MTRSRRHKRESFSFRILRLGWPALLGSLAACSSSETTPSQGTGGVTSVATGGVPSGGALGTGGASTSGGASTTGGASTSGGASTTGGASTSGGTSASGGNVAGGGSSNGGSAGSAMAGSTATTGGSSGNGAGGGGGTTAGTAGAANGGSSAGTPTFSRPEGTIPNDEQPEDMVDLERGDWQDGLIAPTRQAGHHLNQPTVVNGYLVIGGNEEYWIYDVSNPAEPEQLSEMLTPNRCATCGPKAEGEAEAHTVSFGKYGDTFYMVTTGGRGIDSWDVTDPRAPVHLDQLTLPGVDYGDNTNAVWGLWWQGSIIYVGSTNNGIDIIDASDPTNLVSVRRIGTNTYGGVSAGPLEAVGNILVVMTPKDLGGIATLDISDPLNPVPLDSFTTEKSYIGQFYRHHAFLIGPIRAWDVLSDPTDIGSGTTPDATLSTGDAEYLSFSDDNLFLGMMRPNPGISKIDVTNLSNMQEITRVWGRLDQGDINDDQFNIALGNLVVMTDDEAPYAGWTIGVHATDPDVTPPVVDTVIPKNAETGRAVTSRIGISFTDNIELATVNEASFIVRPVGGQPIPGKWGVRMSVLNFDPDQDLAAETTYEVVLPAGGITDLVGNALAQEFKSTFTTR